MLSTTEIYKLTSAIALAVSVGAAGIYFVGLSNAHPLITLWTIAVSFLIALVCGIIGASIPKSSSESGPELLSASISGVGINTGQQIVGNTGTVHIGDVHHAPPISPTRDYRAEWLHLYDRMRQDCGDRRVDWSHNNLLGENWDIKGLNRNLCKAWSRQAGALLVMSPRVRARLSAAVLDAPDDLSRWMRYLKENYVFESGPTLRGTTDDGRAETIHTGTLSNLGEQSAKACIDCSTYET